MTLPAERPVRVLVVDDDASITQVYREILSSKGYDVLTAGNCEIAMQQIDGVGGDVGVLLIDFGLPDCDGADLVRDIVAKYGSRPTMYVSGWTDEFWQLQNAPGRWLIMRKPVPVPKLLAAIGWLAHGGNKPAELDEQ